MNKKVSEVSQPQDSLFYADASEMPHPEDALFNAGAYDQYYEIVGASYTPATKSKPATATIDLSTVDQSGCLLSHDYGTSKTTLHWDTDHPKDKTLGSQDDVLVAVHDITRESMSPSELFDAFQAQMTIQISPKEVQP